MTRLKEKPTHVFLIFLGIVLFASVIHAFSLFHQSIRLDEAQSIWVATKPISSILAINSQDVHVPLYTVLLHFWIQILGSNIYIIRTLSFLLFLATLPVLYIFVKEASSKKVALVTVLFFSFSPFILWYTSEARMYTLFTFTTSLNHLYFLRLLRSEGQQGKFGYIVSLILGFYTHYFFLFLVITQAIFLVVRWGVRSFQDKDDLQSLKRAVWKHKKLPFLTALLAGIASLFFLPWIYYVFISGSAAYTQPHIPPPTSFNLLQTFVNFIFGFQAQGIQSIIISLWPMSVLILFLVFTRRRHVKARDIDYFIFATFVPVILVFLISMVRPIYLSRYLILVTPTLFFLLAWTLLHYTKRVATIAVGSLLVIMFSLLLYQNTSAETPVREDYQSATSYLSERARPIDIILVSAPFTVYPIEYSYTGHAKIVTIPQWNRFGNGGIPEFSEVGLLEQMKEYEKVYAHAYLVLSYDQGYEDKIRKYFDRYHLLSRQQFSPGLEIREYRLSYNRN